MHTVHLNNALIKNCQYCDKLLSKANLCRHEKSCLFNPNNKRLCPICQSQIMSKKKNTLTCSYSCANKYTKTGINNGFWKDEAYRSTCFLYHKKECIICGEKNIVAVHHLDENRKNNSPDNLIPLCPTHHTYWHSSFKHLIENQIYAYLEEWSRWQGSNLRSSVPKTDGLPLSHT